MCSGIAAIPQEEEEYDDMMKKITKSLVNELSCSESNYLGIDLAREGPVSGDSVPWKALASRAR
jgi:hypothetical protein